MSDMHHAELVIGLFSNSTCVILMGIISHFYVILYTFKHSFSSHYFLDICINQYAEQYSSPIANLQHNFTEDSI